MVRICTVLCYKHLKGLSHPVGKATQTYPGQLNTGVLERLSLAVSSALTAIQNPLRQDAVAVLGEVTGDYALDTCRNRMLETDEGTRILKDRPLITSESMDLPRLRNLPSNTLGRAYVNWLDNEGVSPDTRCAVRYVADPELAYVMRRYRETHDMVHVLLGLPTSVAAELAIKWFELAQTQLPMTGLAGVFGPLRLWADGDTDELYKLRTIYVPWALEAAKTASFLPAVYFEERLEQDLQELRAELGIPPAPPIDDDENINN
eukprot:Clim_evm21s33 gene=Clim_evmTU21s33